MSLRRIALLLPLAAIGCGHSGAPRDRDLDPAHTATAAADLDFMCGAFSDPELRGGSAANHSFRIAASIDAYITHPGVRSMFSAIAGVAVRDRYRFVLEAAREMDVPDWRCPAMEQLWGSTAHP